MLIIVRSIQHLCPSSPSRLEERGFLARRAVRVQARRGDASMTTTMLPTIELMGARRCQTLLRSHGRPEMREQSGRQMRTRDRGFRGLKRLHLAPSIEDEMVDETAATARDGRRDAEVLWLDLVMAPTGSCLAFVRQCES